MILEKAECLTHCRHSGTTYCSNRVTEVCILVPDDALVFCMPPAISLPAVWKNNSHRREVKWD